MDIHIRQVRKVGRITLKRPKALNALTYDMCLEIEKALDRWAESLSVEMVVIDAEGDKAFCAGGDIQEMFDTASAGNFDYGRQFWRDEYRLNAKICNFPKPYAAFMQGFTMGGGVGVSCHGSHRVVCESSRIAMPECGIGLIPDVGGSLLLARAPGRLGEYLGTTGARMDAGDAIYAGFADYYIPRDNWEAVIDGLEGTADWEIIDRAAEPVPPSRLAVLQKELDVAFAGDSMADIMSNLQASGKTSMRETMQSLTKKSPISIACTPDIIRSVRQADDIGVALTEEYRFTHRSASDGDFIEGIKAAIIDRTHTPQWRFARLEEVTPADIAAMRAPLGDADLKL